MEKLVITSKEGKWKIDYSERFAKGIYMVFDKKLVKKNCSILKIQLDEPLNDLEMVQKVTVFGKTGIVSIRIDNDFHQYILMPSTEREDFVNFLSSIPDQSHEALRGAFNMRNIENLKDLSFLGSGLSNKN